MLDLVKGYFKKSEEESVAENVTERNKQKDNNIREHSVVHRFIPYACYYDKNTLLTKDGQLLQSIRVKGLSYDVSGGDDSLRDSLVNSVFKNVPSNEFSFYLHTIRRKNNFDDSPQFNEKFAHDIHSAWVDSNQWDNGFVNDLYITIIHSGMSVKVNTANFIKYFSFDLLKKNHNESLQEAHKNLVGFTNNVIKDLKKYNPILLGLEKGADGHYTSNLLRFFYKIVHLDDVNIPVMPSDISKQMGEYQISFGNNALEVKNNDKKLFASILSMKEYNPISKIGINKILSLSQQMVITQTINFIDPKQAKKDFEYQKYILLDVSKNPEVASASNLDVISKDSPENNTSTSFCKSQITIMALDDTLEFLEKDVQKIYKVMSDLGIPLVREDLRMEGCFWSQLPGNFIHIQRQFILHYSLIGGFSVLGGFPFGNIRGQWGNYVCLFKTIFGTPYFFNFHVQENGHTLVVGDYDNEKLLLMNFLLSESLKFNPKIMYIDTYKSSKLFITLMGGKYLDFTFDKKDSLAVSLNPLLLEDRPENREFIGYWFLLLMDQYLVADSVNRYIGVIKGAVDKVFAAPVEKRRLNNVKEFFSDPSFKKENDEIVEMLSMWCKGGGITEEIFNSDTDDLLESLGKYNICAIDLVDLLDVPMSTQLPIILYILHCFRIYYTGENPSIFALTQANKFMHNMYFMKNLETILDDLMLNNSVFIGTASFYSEQVNWSEKIAVILNKKIANKFFMGSHASSYGNIKDLFNISSEDMIYVQSFSDDDNRFLLKHNNLSILSSVNFSNKHFSDAEIISRGYVFEKQFEEFSRKYDDDIQKALIPFKEYIQHHA